MGSLVHRVTAVVPARNAELTLGRCLDSLRRGGIGRIIVVDGCSTDATVETAQGRGAGVLSDAGGGLPLAGTLGVQAATTPLVLLVDSDVVFPAGSVERLVAEFEREGYDALQDGMQSHSGAGNWGQALAEHHRTGRSRWWFGLVATVMRRDRLAAEGFDDDFRSGEDIELRWRLQDQGLRIGVSRDVVVQHWFVGDDFAFAKDQFLMDGTGLGLMVRKHGWRGLRLVALPLAAALRGTVLTVARHRPEFVRYYAAYCFWNYLGLVRGLRV